MLHPMTSRVVFNSNYIPPSRNRQHNCSLLKMVQDAGFFIG